MSTDPSNIFTTSPIEGRMLTSSWMHQNAVVSALVSCFSSTAPSSRLSATFVCVPFVNSCKRYKICILLWFEGVTQEAQIYE